MFICSAYGSFIHYYLYYYYYINVNIKSRGVSLCIYFESTSKTISKSIIFLLYEIIFHLSGGCTETATTKTTCSMQSRKCGIGMVQCAQTLLLPSEVVRLFPIDPLIEEKPIKVDKKKEKICVIPQKRFGGDQSYLDLTPTVGGLGTIPYRPLAQGKTYQIKSKKENFTETKKVKQKHTLIK